MAMANTADASSSATERSPMLPVRRQQSRRARDSLIGRLHRHSKTLLVAGIVLVVAALGLSVSPSLEASVQDARSAVAPAASSRFPLQSDGTRDLLPLCEEKFITQELDHFRANGGGGTFEQRYFVCSRETFKPEAHGAIFFYVGNEADVTLYLNNTGLMWENAQAFDALVVFAEHRYFGKSIPFGSKVLEHMEFLSSTQALADYAVLVEHLKDSLAVDVPVIGFGGSYGGMLGTWFRTKYPHIVDGVIAASAPIRAFMGDRAHPVDTEGFQRVVTFDMSEAAGSAPNCISNVRRAIAGLLDLGGSASGRQDLAKLLRVCPSTPLDAASDVQALVDAVVDVYGNLAMGNYPYSTSYITSGESDLPAYPMRAACEPLRPDIGPNDTVGLLTALRESVGVFLNASTTETCLFPPPPSAADDDRAKTIASLAAGGFYSYLECAELYAPFSRDGVHDAFPPAPVDLIRDDNACFEQWGVRIRPDWTVTQYGGAKALAAVSNIVLSNGGLDPWSAIGVNASVSDSVVFVPVPGGAHHLDLFFSHPLDPPGVTAARQTELEHVRKWIDAFYAAKARAQAQ